MKESTVIVNCKGAGEAYQSIICFDGCGHIQLNYKVHYLRKGEPL